MLEHMKPREEEGIEYKIYVAIIRNRNNFLRWVHDREKETAVEFIEYDWLQDTKVSR